MNQYREIFNEAIEQASDKMPDIPMLLMASAAIPGQDDVTDYPCAIGGRNLHSMDGEPEDLIAPMVRSLYQLCLELCRDDKGDAKRMFARSVERAFGLTISSTEVERVDKDDDLESSFLRKLRGPHE